MPTPKKKSTPRRTVQSNQPDDDDETEPGSGIASGGVADSDEQPSGYYWDKFEEAGDDEEALRELDAELEKHGYAEDGQIRQAIRDRIGEG